MSGSFIDLHVHSTASDGDLAPSEVAERAAALGLAAVALTDHDTQDGVPAFLAATRRLGLTGVPGVEVGIRNELERGLKEVHVLAYLVEPGDHPLGQALRKLTEAKCRWAHAQLERLAGAGFTLSFDEVAKEAEGSPTVRRPHFWKVFARRYPEALGQREFFRATDHGGPLYAPKSFELSLEETVAVIHASGGVAVLAHPAFYGEWPTGALRVLEHAAAAGVDGVETLYAYDFVDTLPGFPGAAEVAEVLGAEARRRGLVQTGGSDFHGGAVKRVALGCMPVPVAWLDALAEAGARRRRAARA